MNKRIRVLALVATFAMLAAACSSGGSDDTPSSDPGASPASRPARCGSSRIATGSTPTT